jgi:hypothetical protein
MNTPEAQRARDLAKACSSLEKNIRSREPDDAKNEGLRAKTVLAMSELLHEFGLAYLAMQVSASTSEFGDIWTVFQLHSSENRSVKLCILNSGEIAVCSRTTRGDHIVFGRRAFEVREVQVFYEHMLLLLGYELPGSAPRELPESQHLRFHPNGSSKKKPWILSTLGSLDGTRLSILVELSQKSAVGLCHILAEPLGWELEG